MTVTPAPSTSDRTKRALHTTAAILAGLAVLLALSAASCGSKPTATAPSTPAIVYPAAPKAHIAYTLKTPPSRWEVTFQNGRVQLRDSGRVQLGYRFDATQRNGQSPLVDGNKEDGERHGWKMEPVTLAAGTGYRATYAEAGRQQLFYFFAQDSFTGTLKADLGTNGDPPTAAAADALVKTWQWKPGAWSGTTWPMPDPELPFTYRCKQNWRARNRPPACVTTTTACGGANSRYRLSPARAKMRPR